MKTGGKSRLRPLRWPINLKYVTKVALTVYKSYAKLHLMQALLAQSIQRIDFRNETLWVIHLMLVRI